MSSAGPREDAYDVIVVGGGLGGVSAAALLAKAGRRVLVVEQGEAAGGYAHSFTRGPYTFDPAVHFTVQAAEGAFLDTVLRVLGVRDRCMLMPSDSLYEARFPGFRLRAPAGKDAFVAVHAAAFPSEARGIREFVELTARLTEESQEVGASVSWRELDEAAVKYPTLFRWRRATLAEALDEHLHDPRLKAVLGASWPYAGLPPSSLSYLTWAATTMSALEDGPFHARKGFQELVDAFVHALEDHGGELVVRCRVERIDVRDGRVSGVTLAGGERLRAPVVIANADARQTFERLVGLEHLPSGFVRRLGRLKPALSACIAFTATSLDLRALAPAQETFLHHSWDHDETYRRVLEGGLGGMWVTIPTLADPSLAPPGEHLAILTSHMPYNRAGEGSRERFGELLVDELEGAFPGFRNHLRFLDVATPSTLERYALNQGGAMYGWANTPSQATSQRPGHRTPLGGLFLSGHWAQPGTGSLRAIFSGTQTAQEVLGYPTLTTFLEAEMTSYFVMQELSGALA